MVGSSSSHLSSYVNIRNRLWRTKRVDMLNFNIFPLDETSHHISAYRNGPDLEKYIAIRIISWKTENSFPPFQNRELKISLPFVFYLETQIRFDFNLRIFLNFALSNIIAFRSINFEILPKNFRARFINGKRLDK